MESNQTNNQNQTANNSQQPNQNNQSNQVVFDLDTKQNIRTTLEDIRKKEQEQGSANNAGGNFVKFTNDKERKRLSFNGKFIKKTEPAIDFTTKAELPGRFVDKFYFECYDITDPNHPTQLSIWQRGARDAKTLLYWLSVDKNVLDIVRHGAPGNKATTYEIYPPMN
jgi:hypothetical protein